MTAPMSQDLRERIVRAVAQGRSARQAAQRFEVSPSAAVKLMQRVRLTGSTALVHRCAGCSRTWPEAGWNRVRILVVPPRMYSCGWVAGWRRGCHDTPGCGTAWKGPASSSHQTDNPHAVSSL